MPFPGFPLQRQLPFSHPRLPLEMQIAVCLYAQVYAQKAFLQEQAPPALANPCAEGSSPVGLNLPVINVLLFWLQVFISGDINWILIMKAENWSSIWWLTHVTVSLRGIPVSWSFSINLEHFSSGAACLGFQRAPAPSCKSRAGLLYFARSSCASKMKQQIINPKEIYIARVDETITFSFLGSLRKVG